jgi:hypothetical protein
MLQQEYLTTNNVKNICVFQIKIVSFQCERKIIKTS